MSELTIHPAAAIFPMMSEEELQDLAADIKAHGLAHPIIIHENGDGRQLIDGRNRLRACEIAGVEPRFTQFDGDDPRAFILSLNVARRHLSKGQQAMAVAMINPEPAKLKRSRSSETKQQFSKVRLSQARTVLTFSRPLAEAVIAGTANLDAAYTQARAGSGKIVGDADRLLELRKSRPDLADQVVGEELTIDEAEEQAKREADEIKQRRWAETMNVIDGLRAFDRSTEHVEQAASMLDPEAAAGRGETITIDRLRKAGNYALALADALEGRQ